MGRRLEYEVKTSVRLNMSNPQHVKINDVIQNLDPKIFKSKNQFIIDAIQFYIDNYGKETFVIKKKEKERAEYIRSEDIDDIKEEVIEAATNEAMQASFPADSLYYEQDGMVVTLGNWLNGRLSCEQIEQLWCELIIPKQNKEQKESEE